MARQSSKMIPVVGFLLSFLLTRLVMMHFMKLGPGEVVEGQRMTSVAMGDHDKPATLAPSTPCPSVSPAATPSPPRPSPVQPSPPMRQPEQPSFTVAPRDPQVRTLDDIEVLRSQMGTCQHKTTRETQRLKSSEPRSKPFRRTPSQKPVLLRRGNVSMPSCLPPDGRCGFLVDAVIPRGCGDSEYVKRAVTSLKENLKIAMAVEYTFGFPVLVISGCAEFAEVEEKELNITFKQITPTSEKLQKSAFNNAGMLFDAVSLSPFERTILLNYTVRLPRFGYEVVGAYPLTLQLRLLDHFDFLFVPLAHTELVNYASDCIPLEDADKPAMLHMTPTLIMFRKGSVATDFFSRWRQSHTSMVGQCSGSPGPDRWGGPLQMSLHSTIKEMQGLRWTFTSYLNLQDAALGTDTCAMAIRPWKTAAQKWKETLVKTPFVETTL